MNGNAMRLGLADESVHCVVTSPPYYALRDYLTAQWAGGDETCEHTISRADADNKALFEERVSRGDRSACLNCGALRVDQQLGLETVPDCLGWARGNMCGECYVCHTVQWARELRRVLRKDGTFWLNLGDSYVSDPAKGGSGTPNGRNGRGENYARARRNGLNKCEMSGAKLKPKDLYGIPWSVAFALREDGWYLRQGIVWAKGVSGQDTIRENAYEAAMREGLSAAAAQRVADAVAPYVGNCMPESVTDRCTKSHEDVFLFSKSARYYFDHFAIREKQTDSSRERANYKWAGRTDDHSNGSRTGSSLKQAAENGELIKSIPDPGYRNGRSVWTINTQGFKGEHYAAFPSKLVEPCVLAGTSEKGCCPKCETQWVRVLQKTKKVAANHKGSLFGAGKTKARDGGERTQAGERYESQFMGWQPSCKCYGWETCGICGNTEPGGRMDCGHNICDECLLKCEKEEHDANCAMRPKPCTVLDPFSGTGTVGEVCVKFGRKYIGNELNQKYIKLQQDRIGVSVIRYTANKMQVSLLDELENS